MQDLPHVLKSRPNLLEITPSGQFKEFRECKRGGTHYSNSVFFFLNYLEMYRVRLIV